MEKVHKMRYRSGLAVRTSSAFVRRLPPSAFFRNCACPPSESVLEADELPRPASASNENLSVRRPNPSASVRFGNVLASAVWIRSWGGRTPPSSVRLCPLETKSCRSAVQIRPWGGRSRRKSSVRRLSPSGIRLRPRTAVPVPRPLIYSKVGQGTKYFLDWFFCNFPIVDYLLVANSHWKEMIMIPF